MQKINAQDCVDFLNEWFQIDPDAVYDLFAKGYIQVNEKTANHPTIQVRANPDGKPPYYLSVLGLLNGIFGTQKDGSGYICVNVDENSLSNDCNEMPPKPFKITGFSINKLNKKDPPDLDEPIILKMKDFD